MFARIIGRLLLLAVLATAPMLVWQANAETLSVSPDVSSGTWTPGISFNGGTTGITYTTQSGQWTRYGNTLVLYGTIVLSNKGSSTGGARITGIPVAVASNGCNIGYYANMATISGQVSCVSNNGGGTTTVDLVQGGATAVANLADTNFTNTSLLIFTLTFRVP